VSDWLILRTAGRSTMTLAKTLATDGYEVWTPIETKTERCGRDRRRIEVQRPIMPTYVFARVQHLVDLLQLASMPVKPRRGAGLREAAHASFHVLHAFGRIPLVYDKHLAELRRMEAKRTPIKRAAYAFPRNASAKVSGGAFGGMTGVVVRSTPAKTVLRFNGGFPVELPTVLFDDLDEVKRALAA
jgi:transcription antitermination factor NusG